MDVSTLSAERHVRFQIVQGPGVHDFGTFCMPGGAPMADAADVLAKEFWTVAEAAELAQVTTDAVHKWRRRGLLKDAGRDRHGRVLLRSTDVIRAEKATRQRARRTYAAA